MTKDYVSNDEELYRNVRSEERYDEYHLDPITGDLIKITSQAFLDKKGTPSVDRAKLNNFDPSKSLLNENNGIVSLITEEVREKIGGVVTKDQKGNKIINHSVDVIPDPNPPESPKNDAHSLIVVKPNYLSPEKQENPFRLLRRALARLATERGWTLEPNNS